MKIIDNVLRGAKFETLEVGATFKYDDDYYLRVKNCDIGYDIVYNAVQLNSGELFNFIPHAEVFPFNCELIVL